MKAFANDAGRLNTINRLFELIVKMSDDEQSALLKDLEKRQYNGKRKHERKDFFAAVDYTSHIGTHKDFIRDISEGGVFIETSGKFSVGHEISMTFNLPSYEKKLKIMGKIARITKNGIGVKFKVTSPVQEEVIEEFVKKI